MSKKIEFIEDYACKLSWLIDNEDMLAVIGINDAHKSVWKFTRMESKYAIAGDYKVYHEFSYTGANKHMFLGDQAKLLYFSHQVEPAFFDVRKITGYTAHSVQGWGYVRPETFLTSIKRRPDKQPKVKYENMRAVNAYNKFKEDRAFTADMVVF